MRYLKTSEAAALLNVTPSTLRAWESRFAFPMPHRSAGNQRMYLHAEVLALREALGGGVATTSAVRSAREALVAGDRSLVAALGWYDVQRADVVMEAALGSRSLQECVEGVLLPTLEQIVRQRTPHSAGWAFAARWAADWLHRATRLTMARSQRLSIVLGDASRDELDPDAPYIRALELFSMRAGVRMMSLSVRGVAGLADAVRARRPDLIVVAGRHIADEGVSAWAQAIRAAAGPAPIALYRRGDQLARLPTTGATILPTRASDALDRLLELAQTGRTPSPALPAARETQISRPRPPSSAQRAQRSTGHLARG